MQNYRPLQRFLRLLSVDRKDIVYIYVYAIFAGLISLTLPLGIQAIISQVLANELSSSWVILIVVVIIGTAVVGGLQIMQLTITEMLQQRIFARASFEFAYRLPRIKMESLTKYYPPELVNRIFDILNVQKGLPKILIDLSTAVLQMFFGLILLSFYHPFFIIFGLILLMLLYLIFRFTGPQGLQTSLAESDYKYKVAYWLEEIARTLSTFKLSGETDLALRKTDDLVTKYLAARKQHFKILITQFGNIVAFKTIVTGGLLIIGSILLIQREINIGQFVASEIVIIIVINSVEKFILSMDTIYDVLTAVEKIGKVTDLPLERHEGINFSEVNTGKGIALRLRNVNFSLPGEDRNSLRDISLDITPGEKVCISGSSGSGKTLLLNIISGIYENYSGTLAYNEVPLRNIDPISVRAFIGDCLSQKILFRGTVWENLTMGRPEVTLKDVQWVMERIGITEYVQSLPEGLNTLILPDGPQLPQSIVRKLILARCIAKRPQLLVMDDFFSIWNRSERERIGNFITCDEMETVIVVSNNAEFAKLCDRIVVMDNGKVIDIETFPAITHKSYYSQIFQ